MGTWNVGDAAADAAVLAKASESGSGGSCAGKKRAGEQTGLAAKAAGSGSRRKCGGKKRATKTLNEIIANMASMCVTFLHFIRTVN